MTCLYLGSDTTAITLQWMIAFLATHPEIQDKVYEEIKEKVGLDRLPGHEDGNILLLKPSKQGFNYITAIRI